MGPLRRIPLLAALLASASCLYFKPQDAVLITSDPPGAHIFIDNEDTGRTTPASFDLASYFGSDRLLELRRRGYRPEYRVLSQYTRSYGSRWIDGASGPDLPPMPIFWTFGDLFLPIGVQNAIVPGDVYVKLYRTDEPLLGFDALAAKQAKANGPGPRPAPAK